MKHIFWIESQQLTKRLLEDSEFDAVEEGDFHKKTKNKDSDTSLQRRDKDDWCRWI